jgi:hypothetical protein
MSPGSPAESAQAILALSTTYPADTSEMPSSESLLGLVGLLQGRVDPTYL